jgi:hypothetical protein
MDGLQREIVDERRSQLQKFARSGSLGSIGVFHLGAGVSTHLLHQDFHLPPMRATNQPQLTFNYDYIIARALVRESTIGRAEPPDQFRRRELDWRRTHSDMLRSLENQWVALEGEQIIAHAINPMEVVSEARTKGVKTPYIFYVESFIENVTKMGL